MRPEEYFCTLLVLVILAVATTGLRFAARRGPKKIKLWWDDAFIAVSCIMLLGLFINSSIMYLKFRMGDPTDEIIRDHNTFILSLKCFYAAEILYFICMLPVKFSVLFLYLRVWTAYKGVVIATKVAIVINIMWFLGGLIPTAVQCLPYSTPWEPGRPSVKCLNMSMLFRSITISNLLTDFIVLMVPVFAVRKLKIGRKKKITLACLFLTGSLTCFCVLLRIVYQEVYKGAGRSTVIADCAFWLIAEPAVAVVGANLPCLKPLVPQHSPLSRFSLLFSSSSGSNHHGQRHSSTSSSQARKSWFGSTKKSGITSTSRSIGASRSDEEDSLPLTSLNGRHGRNTSAGRLEQNESLGNMDNSGQANNYNVKYGNPYWSNTLVSCEHQEPSETYQNMVRNQALANRLPSRALSPAIPSQSRIYVSKEFKIESVERRDEP